MKRKEKNKRNWQKPTPEDDQLRRKKIKSSKPKYRHSKAWLEELLNTESDKEEEF